MAMECKLDLHCELCDESCSNYVELVPIVHAKIMQTTKDGRAYRYCSNCEDDLTDLTMWMTPKYCPNCGAKVEVTYGFRIRKQS